MMIGVYRFVNVEGHDEKDRGPSTKGGGES